MNSLTTTFPTVHPSIVSMIGNTPIVTVEHSLVPEGKTLMLKMESANPNFSVKDRTALGLVKAAFAKEHLKPGGTLVESTSGNLGKSLAMLGAAMEFRTIVIMDPKSSSQNINWVKAYGGQVEMVDRPDENGGYQSARIARVKQIIHDNPDYYWCNQYENPDNSRYHEQATAEEFDRYQFDVLVGAVSTGGHMSGIARGLAARGHPCQTLACDVKGSAIFGTPFQSYLLNGVGLAWRTANMDMDAFSGFLSVDDRDAISICHILARDAGLLLGGSAGLSIFGALAALHNTPNQSAMVMVPDTGTNYLDQFYDRKWLADHAIEPKSVETLRASLAATEMHLRQPQLSLSEAG